VSASFEMSAVMKANAVRNIAGGKGNAKTKAGTKAGLSKAIAHLVREHKRSNKYLLPGGGAKAWRAAHNLIIRTRSGRLKKSYKPAFSKDGMIASYGSDLKYAQYLEEGTRAHGPVSAKALRFKIGGRWVYAKWVKGIRARKHMEKLERREGKAIEKIIADAIAKEFASGK